MGKKREVPPDSSQLVDYGYTVAGHAGTMCDADGILFIKPCTQDEIDFYESANAYHPGFAQVMPEYMGNLMINGNAEVGAINPAIPGTTTLIDPDLKDKIVDAAKANAHLIPASIPATIPAAIPIPGSVPTPDADATQKDSDNVTWAPNKTKKIKTDTSVVLENATHGFSRPNILDAKLGRRLWADDAPLQKKERFDKITAETTHGNLGFRIAGMRTYRGSLDKGELDENDYRIYDKDYGRVNVNEGNVVAALRAFIFNPAAGIDADLGRAVAAGFARDLRGVEEALLAHESRMYSASLLFVFEGDGDKLTKAIKANNDMVDEVNRQIEEEEDDEGERKNTDTQVINGDTSIAHATAAVAAAADADIGRASLRVDSVNALMTQDGNDEDEGDDEEDEEEAPAPPMMYRLKLIDFAHAQWTPGLGPDENALLGVRSLIKVFDDIAA